MGIYVFSRETLFDLLNTNPSATDFGKEIIPASLARGDKLQSFLFDDYWEDIGTIGAFFEANRPRASCNKTERNPDGA
jgi:glucose-1-phosphate adenylyltransferase